MVTINNICMVIELHIAYTENCQEYKLMYVYYTFIHIYISIVMGFSCGSAGKEAACNAGDLGLIPGLGRSLGEGKSYPLQYSGLENSMDCIVHGVTKSRT